MTLRCHFAYPRDGEAGADEEGRGEAVGEDGRVLGGADLRVGDRGEDCEAERAADCWEVWGRALGDVTTLRNPEVMQELEAKIAEQQAKAD